MTPPESALKAPIPGGYLLIARKMLDSDLMNWPPHYLKLWVWMLAQANWKDRDKLKRGQFITTIASMQEAGGYKVGYRTKRLTVGQVRSAYEAFTKSTMIITAKSTRGMIITICNYAFYQNPTNYEQHSEQHGEETTNNMTTAHDTEEREEGKKEKESFSIPARSLLDLWNGIVKGSPLPQVREFSKDREKKCRVRLKERSLEEWEQVFRLCATTPFLTGVNAQAWKVDFDWIIKNDGNSAKVIEGKYSGNGKAYSPTTRPKDLYAGVQ